MQFSSPKEYLKQLKIQRFYVNKFKVNYAYHNNLTTICNNYIYYLDEEIKRVENIINYSYIKKKYSKDFDQIDIYSFME